jgi:3-hydroxymyristoyl/3-hydroxydecanoyl-(acyl carrier protein) dehydratase
MQLPASFTEEFLADLPYDPEVLFFDRIEELDVATSRIVCRMPTDQPMPFTDHQRAHPVRHPRHVSGAVMVQLTGNLGFVHAYHIENLRHRDGWIGYGTHIDHAVFRKLVPPGAPLFCACTQLRVRRGRSRMFAKYKFEFVHLGEIVFESEQSAMWIKADDDSAQAAG